MTTFNYNDTHCYHCGEDIPPHSHFQVDILGSSRAMCCPGCEAVATTIVQSGLSSYYEFRTEPADKAELVPEELQALTLYDNHDIQQDFVHQKGELKEALLSIEGVSCAACAWLIERQVHKLPGVKSVKVNTTTHRALLCWDENQIKLSEILTPIHQLGYKAAPFEADAHEQQYHRAMKQYLYRLGIAGIATMQVMMLAFALYFEVFGDLSPEFKQYFRWVSLIFSTPVLLYSALPFYLNAWRNLKARTLGMDVPVSIALLFAYFASLYATVMETGEVFFESIAMFTFFLLLGRFLEMRARRQAAAASANLLKLIPAMARLASGEQVAAKKLKKGDVVTVLAGERIPTDGNIVSGKSTVNESMLTGESKPITKELGATVFAGTINGEGILKVKVENEKNESLISQIVRLQDEAQQSKPQIAIVADVVARYFVAAILTITAFTWLYWHFNQPNDALWITLAVLVATCPCALSLATPTALTCSTSSLSRLGILLRREHVLETLCNVNRLIIDKTGTLTEGNIQITETHLLSEHYSMAQIQTYAAGLEFYSSHPIARAFQQEDNQQKIQFDSVENHVGFGLQGHLGNDIWRIGKYAYITELSNHHNSTRSAQCFTNIQHYPVWLSVNGLPIAAFSLSDPIRPSSFELIEHFHNHGIKVTMLTGDHSDNAQSVAQALNIDELISNQTPQEKLNYLKSLPKSDISLMVGDGVNDAPVLAGAHLSLAMGGGTDIAKSSADMVLLGDNLQRLLDARALAQKTQNIIKQNLAWALGYNLIILPLAVCGYVAPYIAVIGMSASSLIVVSNSLRLLK
ncbi:TPA: heavy metal translocating P-type ATPase [Photobacterium damselae]